MITFLLLLVSCVEIYQLWRLVRSALFLWPLHNLLRVLSAVSLSLSCTHYIVIVVLIVSLKQYTARRHCVTLLLGTWRAALFELLAEFRQCIPFELRSCLVRITYFVALLFN